jgi:hypothetical protein
MNPLLVVVDVARNHVENVLHVTPKDLPRLRTWMHDHQKAHGGTLECCVTLGGHLQVMDLDRLEEMIA